MLGFGVGAPQLPPRRGVGFGLRNRHHDVMHALFPALVHFVGKKGEFEQSHAPRRPCGEGSL